MSKTPPSRRVALMAAFAALCVLIPFLGWQATWFGRRLTETEIDRYLSDGSRPRKVQHALSQVADRIQRGGPAAERWYPRVVELSRDSAVPIRNTAAWVMGHDNRSALFHAALLALLADGEPMVRRNAALALVRFGDAAGRAELLAMLEPYTIRAPEAGAVEVVVRESGEVGGGTVVARLHNAAGNTAEIRAPFAGTVERVDARDGRRLSAGDPVASLRADDTQVWEALRALYLVGEPEDLPRVEREAAALANAPDRVRRQAALTARAIRNRSEPNPIR
jgi:hypothetical protein